MDVALGDDEPGFKSGHGRSIQTAFPRLAQCTATRLAPDFRRPATDRVRNWGNTRHPTTFPQLLAHDDAEKVGLDYLKLRGHVEACSPGRGVP